MNYSCCLMLSLLIVLYTYILSELSALKQILVTYAEVGGFKKGEMYYMIKSLASSVVLRKCIVKIRENMKITTSRSA
jgi:hypothetical protein